MRNSEINTEQKFEILEENNIFILLNLLKMIIYLYILNDKSATAIKLISLMSAFH